uniref:Uncharacterized protein n=1 Tax=Tardiphaga robiniae TaxID=943830 RepID=A0A109ZYC4_9BRAD|nr:hypothetical protein PROKKA_00726 [Tardiphaga robiniae]
MSFASKNVAPFLYMAPFRYEAKATLWSHLSIAVMRRPSRCLLEWRAAGARIIATVSGTTPASGTGPLSDWPKARGTGPRSLLPR